jgi:hypothetical protein
VAETAEVVDPGSFGVVAAGRLEAVAAGRFVAAVRDFEAAHTIASDIYAVFKAVPVSDFLVDEVVADDVITALDFIAVGGVGVGVGGVVACEGT